VPPLVVVVLVPPDPVVGRALGRRQLAAAEVDPAGPGHLGHFRDCQVDAAVADLRRFVEDAVNVSR
jgi:hypothetical protein